MANRKRKRKLINPFSVNSNLEDYTQVMKRFPISAMIASMQMQIDILRERGVEIHDWDNKGKSVKQIQILCGKVYFLSTEDGADNMD